MDHLRKRTIDHRDRRRTDLIVATLLDNSSALRRDLFAPAKPVMDQPAIGLKLVSKES